MSTNRVRGVDGRLKAPYEIRMIPNYFRAIPIAAEQTKFLLNDSEKKALLKLKYHGADGSVQVSDDYRILERKSLKRVKEFIISKVDQYKKDILCIDNKLCLTQSWSTINKKGSQHHKHTHPNTFISLVYYVDCDENSGDLIFKTPRSSIQEGYYFNFKIIENNEYNSSGWKFNTRPGYICIFPGQVEHYSTPHQGDKDRIIIGANFFVESALGDYNNTDRMILNVSVK